MRIAHDGNVDIFSIQTLILGLQMAIKRFVSMEVPSKLGLSKDDGERKIILLCMILVSCMYTFGRTAVVYAKPLFCIRCKDWSIGQNLT